MCRTYNLMTITSSYFTVYVCIVMTYEVNNIFLNLNLNEKNYFDKYTCS